MFIPTMLSRLNIQPTLFTRTTQKSGASLFKTQLAGLRGPNLVTRFLVTFRSKM